MSSGVIADNWSLQDISALFDSGLSNEETGQIIIDGTKHIYKPISSAVIQAEALFDLLTDLILRDEIIVDSKFTNTWEYYNSPLLEAKNIGIIRDFPFLINEEILTEPRTNLVAKLCVTTSLKDEHGYNVQGWESSKITPYPLLSATLWGGAGMLARSQVYERGYTPHPLRRRLFINTGIMLDSNDALTNVKNLINENRLKLLSRMLGGDAMYSMFVNLPPLPICVINESHTQDDFIKIALQMRSEFTELRNWIKSFQETIAEDDIKMTQEHYKLLDSVTKHIDAKLGNVKKGKFSFSAGIGIFKIAYNGDLVNDAMNKFGVRATINKLILKNSGKNELNKFCKIFNVKNTDIERQLKENFSGN